jgi:hypothetical protein
MRRRTERSTLDVQRSGTGAVRGAACAAFMRHARPVGARNDLPNATMTSSADTPARLVPRLIRSARRGPVVLLFAVLAACGSGIGIPTPPDGIDAAAPATGAALDTASSAPAADPAGASAPAVAPGAPTLTATAVSGALRLGWTASADATSYRVQKQLDGGPWTDDGPSLDAATLAADRPLPVAQWARARFRVQACNAAGCSASVDVQAAASMASTLRYLKASNTGADDQFGYSVALSTDGGTLAVGARYEDSAETGTAGTGADNSATDSGAVYVFVRSGGTWTQQAYLKAANAGAGDLFGFSVALSADGSLLAVGAVNEDSGETGTAATGADDSATNSGAVYVFARGNGTWTQQAYLKASNTGGGDQFGWRVALSADGATLAVGAPAEDSAEMGTTGTGADNTATDSGAVYVFTRGGGTWTQQAYVKASNTGGGDQFGISVALSADGGALAIGANAEDSAETGTAGTGTDNSATDSGAVYLLTRAGGTWTQQAYLKASNTGSGDQFGVSVALSADGGTLAVGATFEDSAETGTTATGADDSATDSGAVYVFTRAGGTWTQQAYLKASNTGGGDRFGRSIALAADGRTLVVGANHEASAETGIGGTGADNSAASSGAVYVFGRDDGAWTQRAYLKASNPGTGDQFGFSVALSADGGTLAVGGSGEDSAERGTTATGADESATNSGAVYVF